MERGSPGNFFFWLMAAGALANFFLVNGIWGDRALAIFSFGLWQREPWRIFFLVNGIQ